MTSPPSATRTHVLRQGVGEPDLAFGVEAHAVAGDELELGPHASIA